MVKTGAIFKNFTFDGLNSTDYGVYITGAAVYNAPVRDVQMIEIPGRNGAFALDNGRFANIPVTYPAGMYGNSESDFANGISELRNALASRKGYCRLTDEYNPDEYRLGVYKSGLEVTPARLKAGEFDIVFDCKPQRFLTSGETETTVTSGATITNPTLFDSHPLLLVDGYGDIDINGEDITIQQGAVMGRTLLENAKTYSNNSVNIRLDSNKYLTGDSISLTSSTDYQIHLYTANGDSVYSVVADSVTNGYRSEVIGYASNEIYVAIGLNDPVVFTAGTASTAPTGTAIFTARILRNGSIYDVTITLTLTIGYITNIDHITLRGTTQLSNQYLTILNPTIGNSPIYVDSTKSALGQLYIDLDIGECYRIENGEYISINTATTLPADLPTLKPGANVITYANTFTSFKITPRWFKI